MAIESNRKSSAPEVKAAIYSSFVTVLADIRSKVGVLTDVNSAARNTVSATAKITTIVAASTLIGGALTVANAAAGAHENIHTAIEDSKTGHTEAVVQHSIGATRDLSLATMSALTAVGSIMTLNSVAVPVAMAAATSAVPFAFYAALLIHGANDVRMARNFAKKLEDDRTGAPSALIATLDSSSRKELQKVIAEKSDDETTMEAIRKANFKRQMRGIIHMIIALIGIAASIMAILATGGAAAPILFAASALIWLTVDSTRFHNWLGDKCWKVFHYTFAPSENSAYSFV